jgi:hypothetical protein
MLSGFFGFLQAGDPEFTCTSALADPHWQIPHGTSTYVCISRFTTLSWFLNYLSILCTSFPGPLSLGPPWCMLLCYRLELTQPTTRATASVSGQHSDSAGMRMQLPLATASVSGWHLVGGSLQHSGGLVKKGDTLGSCPCCMCCPYFAKTIHV